MKNNIIKGACCGDCAKCELDVDMIPCAVSMIFKNVLSLRQEIETLKKNFEPTKNMKHKIIADYEQEQDSDTGEDSVEIGSN